MDWLFGPLTEMDLQHFEEISGTWFFYASIAFLVLEIVRYIAIKKFRLSLIGDVVTNYITLAFFIAVNFTIIAGIYITVYFGLSDFAIFEIPVNLVTIIICVILADLAYYWEHRFLHRVNLAWATHSVHHSSPFFNISVAYRFGPLDGLWPMFFHAPLIVLGFNPFVVILAELLVQLFQTALHTEWVRKLPKPIEAVFNTPSHHRAHHASNEKYLDANYAGIFIVWDRLFGTFVEEDEAVVYGLVKPIPEVNSPGRMLASPFVAFFHGFWRLGKGIVSARTTGEAFMYLFGTPEWEPKKRK